MPNITAPRLASKSGAISQWTENGGARFKSEFERALSMTLAALQHSLGGKESADGLFALGTDLMYRKEFAEAHACLQKARSLAPDRPDIANTMAVNLAHHGQVDDAIALSETIAQAHDDNATAHMNLAWWYATEKNLPEQAREHYNKARSLGMSPVKKLEKMLGTPATQ